MRKNIFLVLAVTLSVGAIATLVGKYLYDNLLDTTSFDFDDE